MSAGKGGIQVVHQSPDDTLPGIDTDHHARSRPDGPIGVRFSLGSFICAEYRDDRLTAKFYQGHAELLPAAQTKAGSPSLPSRAQAEVRSSHLRQVTPNTSYRP